MLGNFIHPTFEVLDIVLKLFLFGGFLRKVSFEIADLKTSFEGLDGLAEVLGEFLGAGDELLAGLIVNKLFPVGFFESVDERFIDGINDDVELGNGVVGDFSEEDIVVEMLIGDLFAFGGGSEEVNGLVLESFFFVVAFRHEEGGFEISFLYVVGVDAVVVLVEEEQLGNAFSGQELGDLVLVFF